MKRRIAAIAALAALSVPAAALSQEAPRSMPEASLAEVRPMVDRFVSALQANDAQGAIHGLLEGSPLRDRTPEIAQLVAQTTLMLGNSGAVEGAEYMDSDCATDRYCRVRYVLYGERTAMGMWLYLYKPRGRDWSVMTILVGEAPPFFFGD